LFIQATENLLQTVSETATENGNQLVLLTAQLRALDEERLSNVELLSDFMSNHTLDISRLENEVIFFINLASFVASRLCVQESVEMMQKRN